MTQLHYALSYNPGTGEFHWVAPPPAAHRVKAGDAAGTTTSQGYSRIRLNGRNYMAHRLAWLWVHGALPEGQIDHINGDRSDNRIANLRVVPARVNSENRRSANANNSTGLLGVSRDGKRFVATIRSQGTARRLGYFATAEEAHACYLAAKRELHDGCTL